MAVLGAVTVQAQVPALDTLVKNSPFGNVPSQNAVGNADNPLEFRGVFVDKGEPFFSLYDGATRRSMWVGMQEPGNPVLVRDYDEAAGAVVVEYQGRTLTVPLKQVRIPAVPAVAPGVAGPPPAQATAQASATPPDEAVRLAQIAEEIRRRRAIRAQLLQPNASGQRPPAPQPGPANPPASPGNRP